MAVDEELAARVLKTLGGVPHTEKRMFGGLGFMVGGHMAVAVGDDGLMVRCAPEDTDALSERDGASPTVMRGKAMRGWLDVTTAAVADDEKLAEWVDVGVEYVTSLPPK